MNYRNFLLIIALLVPLLAGMPARAQEQAVPSSATSDANLQRARAQLQSIQQSLVEKRRQLDQMRAQLQTLTDQTERADLQNRISQGELDMSTLRRSFENIALGGVDSSVFEPARQNLQFNWQQELLLILEPLFQKMKELTDKPRQVEQLRSRIALHEGKRRVVDRALENLDRLRTDEIGASTRQWLDVIYQAWTQQRNDIQRELDITQLRLNVLQADDDSILQRIRQSLNDFITGSGRNLALAITAFISTLFFMKGLFFFYNRVSRRNIRMSTSRRILTYGYHTLTLIASTAAALSVLYLFGDMMLLVIAVIILVLVLLGLRNKVPLLMEETRMLLDIGPVREHERVIYRELPWQVRSIGVFSYLSNPALNGLLRLPMSETMKLISRPTGEDEPWFPTRTGDWVMFSDGSMGQILKQTPDSVQIRIRGSIVVRDSAGFMKENVRNLSQGYAVSITFGIDYKHQAISTTEVPEILKKHIEQVLQQSVLGKHAENLIVEFQEAAASSLNYLVAMTMDGAAADSYFAAIRLLQRACVECCNVNGWVIPFNQITVNAGAGFVHSGTVATQEH